MWIFWAHVLVQRQWFPITDDEKNTHVRHIKHLKYSNCLILKESIWDADVDSTTAGIVSQTILWKHIQSTITWIERTPVQAGARIISMLKRAFLLKIMPARWKWVQVRSLVYGIKCSQPKRNVSPTYDEALFWSIGITFDGLILVSVMVGSILPKSLTSL